jgi:hypothetical protein
VGRLAEVKDEIKFGDVARRLPASSPQGDFSHGGGLVREAVTAQLRWSVQMLDSRCPEAVRGGPTQQWQTWLVLADRLTATERAMASTVRGRPRPHLGGFS